VSLTQDVILYLIGGLGYVIFGSGSLESTLNIFVRIGDCCEAFHSEKNSTCGLPGFIEDYYNDLLKKQAEKFAGGKEIRPVPFTSKFVFFPEYPELEACNKDIPFNSWRCTMCINEQIQPRFVWKGAAGVGLTEIYSLVQFYPI
jgi:hypothetical protein